MANPITAAWSYLTNPYSAYQRPPRGPATDKAPYSAYQRPRRGPATDKAQAQYDKKFSPASPDVNWEQVQSLVYTFQRNSDDYSARGDGNSAVFACLMALATGSIEPPLSVFRKDAKQKFNPIPNHPMQDFLDDPNPLLDMLELRFWSCWAKHVDGNAYLLKVRSGNAETGNVVELWPVSPRLIMPWTEKGSRNFIDYYRYEVKPGVYEQVPIENVIHFRLGIDDRDPRRGLSPIKRLVREIASDAEATRWQDQLLKNFAIPGLVVEVPKDTDMTEDQKRDLKSKVGEAFGSDNRGNVGVLTGGAAMKQFGFNPDQMGLDVLHNFPESRICAAMGVHPAVAMVGVGLTQTANYASLRAVYEAFTERKLVPMWRMDEVKWTKQLKPDFTSEKNIVIMHDLADVRALQEDQDALYTRLDAAVKTGWMLPDEARSEVGLPPMPDGSGMEKIAKPAPALPGAQPGQDKPLPAGTPAANGEKSLPLDTWAEDLQGLVDEAALVFTGDMERLQNGTKRRVKRALIGGG